MRRRKRKVKIKAVKGKRKVCVFCGKPHQGDLFAKFEKGESEHIAGVEIAVCNRCGEKRCGSIITSL